MKNGLFTWRGFKEGDNIIFYLGSLISYNMYINDFNMGKGGYAIRIKRRIIPCIRILISFMFICHVN